VAKSTPRLRRNALNKDLIIDAAIRVIDADGVGALTIRRVADELGASPMGLYGHVRTRDEILEGLIERAVELPHLTPDPNSPWDQQLRDTFVAVHRSLLAHPGLTEILSTQSISGVHAMRTVEQLLASLRAAGLTPHHAVAAVAALQSYTYGFTVQQRARAARDQATHLAALRALPRADFPQLHELAADFGTWTTEDHFETGLDWLLDSIRRTAYTEASAH
jgi:TetR/AcrR family tetracycline transcriptional repressor